MANYSQANRPMRVDTALGEDVLLLEGFSGTEGVSTPFGYTLDLLSENASIAAADVLRKPAWVTIKTPDGGERVIHGLARSFAQLGQSEGLTSYRAEVVPWLWFLSLSSDCKIFQKLSVPEIVEEVFQGLGYADFQNKLVKTYPKRLFCVQYRESHLNFVSRLLEEEGIFYFFEHSSSKHVLTLADDKSAVKPCPGQSKARMAADVGRWQQEDVVTSCECEDAVHTGKVTLRDYDPEQPLLQLESSVSGAQPEESYHYPGKYLTLDEGERYARLQLESEEALEHLVRGSGTCRSFQSGYRFDLKDHYRKDANQTYMLLELRHWGRAGDYRSWESAPLDYRNDFLAMPYSVPYRPHRGTPKPRIWGTQTALVVGKAGEEIWTDKDGRVKVQFYWDRLGKKDENSSCWIRVSQPWAGKGWGSLAIPRIGQEVVVEFLEGDPDRPIITGKVYNADQTPPYDPGKGGVVSGLRSNTHKGKGYNEMSMDDTAGKEKITIHAQYDMSTTVEHDDTQKVVSGNRKIDVVAGTHTETIKGDTTINVSAGKQSNTVNKSIDITSKTAYIHLKAETEIQLEVGSSKLLMKKDGTISLTGVDIGITGSKSVTVKGGIVHSEADSEHQTKGAVVMSEGSATNTVKGGMVMLNP
jgi:type VI secretion system secreted protein VgrG